MYGKPEPGKKLFQDASDEEEHEKSFESVGLGLLLVGLLAVLFMLVIPSILSRQDGGSGETASGLRPTFTETSPTSASPLKILDYQLKRDAWFAYVEGNIRNTSAKVLGYAEVWAYFYDAAGRRIGESLANTVDLGPDMVWRFQIYYAGNKNEVSRVEVAVGSWWFR